jgi:hypothetical protein
VIFRRLSKGLFEMLLFSAFAIAASVVIFVFAARHINSADLSGFSIPSTLKERHRRLSIQGAGG